MPPMPELWPTGVKGISLPEESLKKTTHQADVYQSFGTQLNFRAGASLVSSIATIIDFSWVCHSTYLLIVTFNWELLGDTEQPKRILFHHSCWPTTTAEKCSNPPPCPVGHTAQIFVANLRPQVEKTTENWMGVDISRYFLAYILIRTWYTHTCIHIHTFNINMILNVLLMMVSFGTCPEGNGKTSVFSHVKSSMSFGPSVLPTKKPYVEKGFRDGTLRRVLTSLESGWWLNQPLWKILYSQIGSWNPKVRGKNEKIFELPPPREWYEMPSCLMVATFGNPPLVVVALISFPAAFFWDLPSGGAAAEPAAEKQVVRKGMVGSSWMVA